MLSHFAIFVLTYGNPSSFFDVRPDSISDEFWFPTLSFSTKCRLPDGSNLQKEVTQYDFGRTASEAEKKFVCKKLYCTWPDRIINAEEEEHMVIWYHLHNF